MSAIESNFCTKKGCTVAIDGICAEGQQPPKACPFYASNHQAEPNTTSELTNEEIVVPAADDLVPLPAGEALDVAEVDEFLRWRPATFVGIVGDRDSGKTTLICSIYDQLLRGPFAGYLFAGSRTIVGLERRSHYARAVSGLTQPDTPHTSISEGLRFFHFVLASLDEPDVHRHLLVSDRAGEVYRDARGNSDLIPGLLEVRKADHLVLLLDGGRLARSVDRAGAIQVVRRNLRAFLDGGALNETPAVQIVTTKLDLLTDHPERNEINERLRSFKDSLRQDFAPRLRDLTFWDIAARPTASQLLPATGVDVLLRSWLNGPVRPPSSAEQPPLVLKREFDRLLARTSM